MFYSIGRLAYRNYQLNVEELKLRSDITSLENEVQDLRNKIVYFQSDSYKEKMARAKLNLQKEGEQVVAIVPGPQAEEVKDEKKENFSNPEKWWRYFFGT